MAIEKYLAGLIDPVQKANTLNSLGCVYLERQSKHEDRMEENRSIAIEYFEAAAQLGHVGAQHNLWLVDMVILSELAKEFEYHGYRHEKGMDEEDNGIPNLEQAIVRYEHAIDSYNGLIFALSKSSISCYDGSEEYKKMIAYNKQRAERGKQRAETNKHRAEIAQQIQLLNKDLGDMLYHSAVASEIGHNGKPEYSKAIKRYKMALARGDKHAEGAMRRLAKKLFTEARNLYHEDKIKEAIVLYKHAARLNHSDAMAALGLLYETGASNNDKPDFKKALQWYDAAIENGSVLALINKAHLYETGEANKGAPDYEQSALLYKRAMEQSSEYSKHAERKLRLVEGKIPPVTRSEKKEEFSDADPEGNKENIQSNYGPNFFGKRPHASPEQGTPPLKRAKGIATAIGY